MESGTQEPTALYLSASEKAYSLFLKSITDVDGVSEDNIRLFEQLYDDPNSISQTRIIESLAGGIPDDHN